MAPVLNAIDLIDLDKVILPNLRYGLVTAQHARTKSGVPSRVVLNNKVLLKKLFSPEHGLDGLARAGEKVSSSVDPLTGLPVYSLYQEKPGNELNNTSDPHTDIDAILYDLPDIGARFYTYIATCLQVAEYCAMHKKKFIVLDRFNPLGGTIIEGLTLQEEDYSFVGPYSLPNRYGLTIGELVKLYISEKSLDLDLTVIEIHNWRRDMLFPDTSHVFVMPSPNIPNWQTALLYPGTCLIEGTNLSEGRGTPRPFTWFGAPYIQQEELIQVLDKIPHPGLSLRPQGFIPTFSKNEGLPCPGIAIEITNHKDARPVSFMVEVLSSLKELYPEDFQFLQSTNKALAFIHRLMGIEFTERQQWNLDYFNKQVISDTQCYKERINRILLYE